MKNNPKITHVKDIDPFTITHECDLLAKACGYLHRVRGFFPTKVRIKSFSHDLWECRFEFFARPKDVPALQSFIPTLRSVDYKDDDGGDLKYEIYKAFAKQLRVKRPQWVSLD